MADLYQSDGVKKEMFTPFWRKTSWRFWWLWWHHAEWEVWWEIMS